MKLTVVINRLPFTDSRAAFHSFGFPTLNSFPCIVFSFRYCPFRSHALVFGRAFSVLDRMVSLQQWDKRDKSRQIQLT